MPKFVLLCLKNPDGFLLCKVDSITKMEFTEQYVLVTVDYATYRVDLSLEGFKILVDLINNLKD